MSPENTGRFAGDEIDDAAESASGAFSGAVLNEKAPDEVAATPRVQKGPTAAGVAPQTVNLFASDSLADNPIAKKQGKGDRATKESEVTGDAEPTSSEAANPFAPAVPVKEEKPEKKKAGVAKRSKKNNTSGNPEQSEFLASLAAESAKNNARRTVFSDTDEMAPTVAEPDRISAQEERAKHKTKTNGKHTMGTRSKEFFERLGKVSFGIFAGLVIGGALGLWALAAIGPWVVTDTGIVPKSLPAPIYNLPAGTEITMTRPSTVAPTGFSRVIPPFILSTAKAQVVSPIEDNGQVIGYRVMCQGGSCQAGLEFDIYVDAILGSG